MNRKLFIKNIGLGFGAMFCSPISSVFSENRIKATKKLNLNAFEGFGNKVKISGNFLDAKTLENISAKITFKKKQTLFTEKVDANLAKVYAIENELGNAFSEKILFKVEAAGYKTFEGQLVVNKVSVFIDKEIWQYNPDFKQENRPNKHKIENGMLSAKFDFHLVKN